MNVGCGRDIKSSHKSLSSLQWLSTYIFQMKMWPPSLDLWHIRGLCAHGSTQCKPFSLNISYSKTLRGGMSLLSHSLFICSLHFDSAWTRMSVYEQAASVLFQVQGLGWLTHYFQMLMKFHHESILVSWKCSVCMFVARLQPIKF